MVDLIRAHILSGTPDVAEWWITAADVCVLGLIYGATAYAIVFALRLAGRWYVGR